MRWRQFFLFLMLSLVVTIAIACGRSTIQTPPVVQTPAATIQQEVHSPPSVSPSLKPISPEALAIAASAGPNGLYNPPRGDVRLVAISDLNSSYGSTDYDPEVDKGIQLIPFWQPDLILCSGDMVAGQSPALTQAQLQAMWSSFDQHVTAPLRRAQLPFGFTVGNHDASSAQGLNGQFLFQLERDITREFWQNPTHNPGVQFIDRDEFPFYYTFELNGIFFLAWDGSSSHIPPEKLAWVEKALASPRAQQAKMRVLLGHLPLYAVAAGRNAPGEVLENAEQLRTLLEKYNVHTYISGHDHAYYPAHRGKLQLLHMGLLGAGPRPYLEGNLLPRKSMTVIDVKFNSPELTTYTTYDIQTLQTIEYAELPRSLKSHNGMVVRRDIPWEDLTAAEKTACEQQLGKALCNA
jgi:hypothetical protein